MLTNFPGDPLLQSKISNSELYSLTRCKKLWDYSYHQGLKPNTTPDYLTRGSFLHSLMAEALSTGDTDYSAMSMRLQVATSKKGEPTVGEPDRVLLANQVTEFFGEMGKPGGEDVVAVEEEFYADIGLLNKYGNTVLLHGFIDAVVRDEAGNLWLVEHKTGARAWSAQQFQFAIQDVLYCAAWEALTGERPVGVQYNFFYPKRWEVRTKYIEDTQYASVIGDVQASVDLRDIMETYPREPLWGCPGCQFRDLCYSELIGADGQYIRDTNFTVDAAKRDRFVAEGD